MIQEYSSQMSAMQDALPTRLEEIQRMRHEDLSEQIDSYEDALLGAIQRVRNGPNLLRPQPSWQPSRWLCSPAHARLPLALLARSSRTRAPTYSNERGAK